MKIMYFIDMCMQHVGGLMLNSILTDVYHADYMHLIFQNGLFFIFSVNKKLFSFIFLKLNENVRNSQDAMVIPLLSINILSLLCILSV